MLWRPYVGLMDNKICGRCQESKPTSAFYRRGAGYQSVCKACHSKYLSEHYVKNRGVYLESNRRARQKNKAFLIEQKSRPCADCGGSFPYYVMDFDHLSDKKFTMQRASAHGRGVLESEMAKCELVCANCHRIRTHNRLQSS